MKKYISINLPTMYDYWFLHAGDAIADLYENARVLQPDSAEILSSLFMAYVRLGSHKKQHQTAMALHKLHPTNNPYYFWAIMSIVMQVMYSCDHTVSIVCLRYYLSRTVTLNGIIGSLLSRSCFNPLVF